MTKSQYRDLKSALQSAHIRSMLWLVIPITAFLAVHVPKILLTGFYHDDWNLFVEANSLSHSALITFLRHARLESRPVQGIAYYLIDTLWNGHPKSLAIISSSFVAASAASLYIFLMKISKLGRLPSYCAPIATTAWILIPWGFGYSVWTTGAVALSSQILFLISSVLILNFTDNGKVKYFAAGIIFLILSYLSYEAFYLSFAAVLAIAVVLGPDEIIFRRRAIAVFAACSIVQTCLALYTSEFTPKHVSVDAYFIVRNIVYYLPNAILSVFYGWRAVALVIAVMLLLAAVAGYFLPGEQRQTKHLAAIAVCCLAIMIATVPFSVASYGLQGIGTLSRTTVGANLWLAVLLCLLLESGSRSKFFSSLRIASAGGLLVMFAIATAVQMRHWADSWSMQQAILERVPLSFVETLPKSSVIVFDSPRFTNGVEVFAAPWDITSALYKRAAVSGWRGKPEDFPQVVPFYSHFPMRWDGHSEFTINTGWSISATQVWEYEPSTNLLWRIQKAGPITAEPSRRIN